MNGRTAPKVDDETMRRAGTHHDFGKQIDLTPRQREVMELLARGYTNGQIGETLGISLDGAKWHVSEIIGKFDVSTREEAVECWRLYRRPTARLARALRAIVPADAFRWAWGGAGIVATGAAIVAVIVIANADSEGNPAAAGFEPTPTVASTPSPTPPAATEVAEEQMALQIGLLRDGEMAMVQRSVEATPGVARAALEALFSGATAEELDTSLASAIPAGTQVVDIAIENGVGIVDLSAEFLSDSSVEELHLRVAQVVFTLTQFSTVDAVSLLVDGDAVEVADDEGPLNGPFTRDDFEGVTPQIFIDSPAQGATVSSPIQISGTANTFEAEFQLEVRDHEGRLLAGGPVLATSGSGERGTFETSMPFVRESSAEGSIVVYEISAEDGSRINVVEVPVRFEQ